MTTRTTAVASVAWPVSTIPGVRFRGLRRPDDYRGMAEASQAARDASGRQSGVTAESLALAFEHFVNFDPERDALIVERDERFVGFARTSWRDQVDGDRAFVSICILRPEERGRDTVAHRLLERRSLEDLDVVVGVDVHHPRQYPLTRGIDDPLTPGLVQRRRRYDLHPPVPDPQVAYGGGRPRPVEPASALDDRVEGHGT